MGEAYYDDEKEKERAGRDRALRARYQLMIMEGNRYGVITVQSCNTIRGHEYAMYQFVPGLERVLLAKAIGAIRSLNRGDTTEDEYKSKD